ncbi:MAG: CdaR family protein, partial [Sphingobacterium sp.]
KVPVRPIYDIDFKKQYGIVGETRSNPEYVTVTGPMEDVANIEFLETDTIRGANVSADIRTVAYLNKHHKTNITIYPTFSEVTIPVGEVTEKIVELPLKIENADHYTSVRTLPSKINVTFLVSLKDYNKWSSRDFEAIVDMENWEKNKVKNLPVIITKVPDFSQVINIEPQNVDFFVRK